MGIMTFSGFPSRGRFTPLPNVFFSEVLPRIDDINVLKVILHVFRLLYPRKGRLRYVTVAELLSDKTLMRGLEGEGSPQELLERALQKSADMGVLVHVGFDEAEVYFLNQEADAEVIEGVRSGEIPLGDMIALAEPYVKQERPDIFGLYEQNIGVLTPMIAEDLAQAENLYPTEWIEEAFKEAVSQNKRSWRYVSRILERWVTEGKGVGESGRHSKKDTSPDKYFKGKYGHLVQR
jgi:DnaD/phage-associated family protein